MAFAAMMDNDEVRYYGKGAAISSAQRNLRTTSLAECFFRPAMSFIVPSSPSTGHRTLKQGELSYGEHVRCATAAHDSTAMLSSL